MDLTDQYLTKGKGWDVRCDENSISSKTYKNSMFIGDLVTWRHDNFTFENSDIRLISR